MATKYQDVNILEYAGNVPEKDYSERDEVEFLNYAYKHLREFEGEIPHLYLDPNGYVTIGIGHLIISAHESTSLPFIYKVIPDPPHEVPPEEKEEAWQKVKDLMPTILKDFLNKMKKFPSANNAIFKDATNLKLDENAIRKIFDDDLAIRLREIRNIFKRYDKYPDPAKLGIIDLYYNVRNFSQFVVFKKCVLKEDWHCAGVESNRKGPNKERLDKARNLFDEAGEIKRKYDRDNYRLAPDNQKSILAAEKSYDDVWQS